MVSLQPHQLVATSLLALFVLAELAAGLGAILHEGEHLLAGSGGSSVHGADEGHHHHHGAAGDHAHSGLILALTRPSTGPGTPSVQPGPSGNAGGPGSEQDVSEPAALNPRAETVREFSLTDSKGLPDNHQTPPTPPPISRLS